MNNSLTTTNGNGAGELIKFNDDQLGLIKRTIAKGANDDQLGLFMYQCQRVGLDPLAKQIYLQLYNNRDGGKDMVVITGIDGYRLIADRTGLYAGNDEAVYDGTVQARRYQNNFTAPKKATVTVYKLVAGTRMPFSASALWFEYYPDKDSKSGMWEKMPCTMLAKCAEAKALRKAFPADLSGVYTREEMQQARNEVEIVSEFEVIKPEPKELPATVETQPVPLTGNVADLRASLEELDRVTYVDIRDALVASGLYENTSHAWQTLVKCGAEGKQLGMFIELAKALEMFDCCIERKEG